MKNLSDKKQMNFEAAKGKTDTEKLLAAYQDEQLTNRIQDAEREIQLLLTRTRMFDGGMLVKKKQSVAPAPRSRLPHNLGRVAPC
jgi:hypothetical protein